ncbi:hypothetical protein KCU61_g548, partial [Aureobasidium melanogenum]
MRGILRVSSVVLLLSLARFPRITVAAMVAPVDSSTKPRLNSMDCSKKPNPARVCFGRLCADGNADSTAFDWVVLLTNAGVGRVQVFALGILAKVVCSQQLATIVVDEINGIVETLDRMYEQHRFADLCLTTSANLLTSWSNLGLLGSTLVR